MSNLDIIKHNVRRLFDHELEQGKRHYASSSYAYAHGTLYILIRDLLDNLKLSDTQIIKIHDIIDSMIEKTD